MMESDVRLTINTPHNQIQCNYTKITVQWLNARDDG